MRKKRLVSFLCVCLMLLGLAMPIRAAGCTLEWTGPDALPEVGEEFSVTVSIKGNPGVSAVQFTLHFDKTVVDCTEIQLGPVMKGMLSASNPDANGGAIVSAASVDPVEKDGVLATFSFTVMQKTRADFELRAVTLADANGSTVAFSLIQGTDPKWRSDTEPSPEPSPEPSAEPSPESSAEPSPEPSAEPSPEPSAEPSPEPDTETEDETGETAAAEELTVIAFSDVPEEHWAQEAVSRMTELGIINGFEDGSFKPDNKVTRAQFVTMLWRAAGSPETEYSILFEDVPAEIWYAKAVRWAAGKGYVNGTTKTTFSPDGTLTRQQAMTMLFRCHGSESGMELMFTGIYDSSYRDSGDIAAYAKPALYWAVYHGIINGVDDTTLDPNGTATRAQIAVILNRYLQKYESEVKTW